MLKKMCLTILLLSLFVNIFSQNCANPNPSYDLIDAGKVLLQRRGGSREHCFTLGVSYPIPSTPPSPDIAVSSSKMIGFNPAGGFDYSISAGRIFGLNSFAINVQINEDVRWTVIQVSYIVSSNKNIVLGSFIGNMFRLTSCAGGSNGNTTTLETYIPSWRINKETNYKVAVFISGLRTLDEDFTVRAVQGDIDRVDGRIVVQIMSNASPGLEYLYLTYIVYPTSFNSNLEFRETAPDQPSSYRLEGVISINSKSVNHNQFTICSKVAGINCPPNEVPVNQKCQCINGFIRVQTICRAICSFNGYINQFGQCICQNGFMLNEQNVCVPIPQCGENQMLSSIGNCVCKQGFYLSNRKTCLPYCPGIGQLWNGSLCICTEGFFKVPNGQCVRSISCKQNQIQQGNQCICIEGFTRNSNNICVLIQCQRNEVNRRGVCQCAPGFNRNRRGICVVTKINCRADQIINPQTGQCDCPPSTVRNGPSCVPIDCQPGYESVNGKCICIRGFARIGSICRPCPQGSRSSNDGETCICPQNSILTVQRDFICTPCPLNAIVQNNACICRQGFSWNSGRTSCITNCPPNATPDAQGKCNCNNGFQFTPNNQNCIPTVLCPPNRSMGPLGQCVCNNGLYLQGNECKPVPTCPPNSAWNQSQLRCECKIANQYLIGNLCQSCGKDQSWNTKQCVCKQGLYKINGVCRVCDIASKYNGTDCQCNIGYYGTRDHCDKCHATCGKCNGPEANQCITCIDISFTLAKGYCQRDTPCPVGYYLNQSSCARCSDYCQSCKTELQCGECAIGFKIQLTMTDQNTAYSSCSPVCGDGRKVDVQKCDDGNLKDGDGCSKTCAIQDGWSCTGGTSVSRSICSRGIPTRSIIQAKGAVNFGGKVIQGVRLSYIPKCFTDKQCSECFKILDVKVIEGDIPTQTKVMYVPNSDGQFIIQYDFGSLISSTLFKYMIRISQILAEDYGGCFSPQDYAQQITGTINTALLAKNDKVDELSLDILDGPAPAPTPTPKPIDPKLSLAVKFGDKAPYQKTVLDKLDLLFIQ